MNINFELPRYKDYRPTGFDRHIEVDDIEDYIVVCGRNRDSNILENCNFEEILKYFGGESEEVQVHRFGHWGCGWFELLLVSPKQEDKAAEVIAGLENYPIWDDEAYSLACAAEAEDTWANASMRDRMYYCQRVGVSFLAARYDEIPYQVYDCLWEQVQ